jgi:hypothetical protein
VNTRPDLVRQLPALDDARALVGESRTVVLVEGVSDQVAVEVLAKRLDRNLDDERIAIVPTAGVTNVGHFLEYFGPRGFGLGLAGLCDAAEAGYVRSRLRRAGVAEAVDRNAMEALGFHVCVNDLEDELIRCLGVATVEDVLEAHGDLVSFRILQRQPAQRGRRVEDQLRRFISSKSRRKAVYAERLVEALDLATVPEPLDRLLCHLSTM